MRANKNQTARPIPAKKFRARRKENQDEEYHPAKARATRTEPADSKRKRSTLRDTKDKARRTKTKRANCPLTFEQAQDLLKRPVAFHPIHAEIAGSVEAGLFLGQALYWTRIQDETNPNADGWFWKTQEQWFAETHIKRSG